jgi:hypothetical protein
MSNGAAGCGYEYRNSNAVCGYLETTSNSFNCLKYHEELSTARVTGEPFRCKSCSDDANKRVESILAKRKAAATQLVRGKLS